MYVIPVLHIKNGVSLALGLSANGTAAIQLAVPTAVEPNVISLTKEDWEPLFGKLYRFTWPVDKPPDPVTWEIEKHTILFRRHKKAEMIEIVIDEVYRCYTFSFTAITLVDALMDFFGFTPPSLTQCPEEA